MRAVSALMLQSRHALHVSGFEQAADGSVAAPLCSTHPGQAHEGPHLQMLGEPGYAVSSPRGHESKGVPEFGDEFRMLLGKHSTMLG